MILASLCSLYITKLNQENVFSCWDRLLCRKVKINLSYEREMGVCRLLVRLESQPRDTAAAILTAGVVFEYLCVSHTFPPTSSPVKSY